MIDLPVEMNQSLNSKLGWEKPGRQRVKGAHYVVQANG